MKKLVAALLALMLILSLMAGCGSQPANDSGAPAPDSSAAAGVEFTDMLGREIKLDAPAERSSSSRRLIARYSAPSAPSPLLWAEEPIAITPRAFPP